jgi:hypothetical protein
MRSEAGYIPYPFLASRKDQSMSSAFLRSKMDERAGLADLMTTTLDKCAKDGADPTPEQRSQLDNWGSRVKELDAEITQLETVLNSNDRFAKIAERVAESDETRERRELERRDTPTDPPVKSLADVITSSSAFTEYRGHGSSARVEVEDIFGLDAPVEERAPLTTALIFPPKERWPGLPGPSITTPLLDAINRERVSTGSFDYVTWPQATGVAKVAELAAKPEVPMTPVLATLSLDTFAGWVSISRQALEDVPRVRSQIETRLRQNLAAVLEAAAAAVIEAATPPQAGGESLAGIREAIGKLQATGYRPTGILINPADFAALDVATMHETNYGPVPTATYWGLRPIPVPGVPIGTSYVADMNQAVTWFDRGTTDVFVTDSHADNFVKNIFVILAEARAQFAVTDVNAMVEVGITQPAPGAVAASSK